MASARTVLYLLSFQDVQSCHCAILNALLFRKFLEIIMEDRKLGVPQAVILAGIIIAVAIVLTRGGITTTPGNTNPQPGNPTNVAVAAISPADHLLGNPSANIVVIEFSDL